MHVLCSRGLLSYSPPLCPARPGSGPRGRYRVNWVGSPRPSRRSRSMTVVLLIGLSAIAWPGTDDPKEAVARLVSPRSIEREAAAEAIWRLGEAAMPAL